MNNSYQKDTRSSYHLQMIQALRKDYQAAISQMEQDVAVGNAEAMFCLGDMHFDGIYAPLDYKRSIALWEHGASLGNKNCRRALIDCVNYGAGKDQDKSKALSMYQNMLHEDPSDYPTMARIGRLILNGWGTTQNESTGSRMLEDAWNCGFVKSASWLGAYYAEQSDKYRDILWNSKINERLDNPTEEDWRNLEKMNGYGELALKWFLQGADRGDARCLTQIGRAYNLGRYGLEKNDATAYSYFMQALEDDWALFFLVMAPEKGSLSDMEIQLFLETAKRVAGFGNSDLQYWLGQAYSTGIICAASLEESKHWLEMAITSKNWQAAEYLGNSYKFGWNVYPKDVKLAYQYYKIGAEADDLACLESLGDLLDDEYIGISPEESDQTIRLCRERTAAKGDKNSISRLATALMNGYRPFEEDKERAALLFEQIVDDNRFYDKGVELARIYIELGRTDKIERILTCLNHAFENYSGDNQSARWLQGSIETIYGTIYRDGFGVKRDLARAHDYFQSAKDKGYESAEKELAHFKKGLFGWKLV